MNINIITLGCSKNLVDSEYLLRQFKFNGHNVFHDDTEVEADMVILNTCGFILDAKEESITQILHYADLKSRGKLKKLIVMGCLSERYKDDLRNEIPEVDAYFGVWDHREIIQFTGSRYYTELANDRLVTTLSHLAFLKISEGCNRSCAFCAIPGIRGRQRSRSLDDLEEEAANLAGRGAKEIILIAQDLTNYGIDLGGKKLLPELLRQLSANEDISWLRMHYAYPSGFPEEVIEIMANDPKVCRYMDIPIQHINDRILTSMNRGHSRKKLEELLLKFRTRIPDVALRTTLMVGYPGETEAEFRELYDFVKDFRFDRLGVFAYSHEDGTAAGKMKDDVPEEVKRERVDQIMQLQQDISLDINQSKIGKVFKVLIDSEEADHYIGRTEFDSPEVDNEVLVHKKAKLPVGEFCNVKINYAGEFDLFGDPVL